MPKQIKSKPDVPNFYLRILNREQSLNWLLNFPFMWILFYFNPQLALRWIRQHFDQTCADIRDMVQSIEQPANHPEMQLDAILKCGFQDFHLTLLRELADNCLSRDPYQDELKSFYEHVLLELSTLKSIFEHAQIRKPAKDNLKNILKYKSSTVYNKLFLLYIGETNFELATHAATKALEGFQSMPDDVPCTLIPLLGEVYASKQKQKELVIKNQTYMLYFIFFITKVRNKDKDGALFYFDKLQAYQTYISPTLDKIFPSFYQEFVKQNDHHAILQFARRFQEHYSFKLPHPKLSKEPEPGYFQKKTNIYHRLYEKHKKLYLEIIDSEITKTIFQSHLKFETINGDLVLSHPNIAIAKTLFKKGTNYPFHYQLNGSSQWMITNWQDYPLDIIMGYFQDLDTKCHLLEMVPIPAQPSSSCDPYDFTDMRYALPQDGIPPSSQKKMKKARTENSVIPTETPRLQKSINLPPKTAGELGFQSIPRETMLYPIHGKHVTPDCYYVYASDLERQIEDPLLTRYLNLIHSGLLVGPKENGFRFVGKNERTRRKLPVDTMMKMAIKRKNERVAVLHKETTTTKDGKRRTLCCASLVFRH